MADEKITFSLEMTDGKQNADASNAFISGPIDIFAVLDKFSELDDPILLDNIRETLKNNPEESIIVFVKEVGSYSEKGSLRYRGAYYKCVVNGDNTLSWKEVAVGTHIHDNKDSLDKIPSPLNSISQEADVLPELVLKANISKNEETGELEYNLAYDEIKKLPELPKSVKDIIEENKKVIDFSEYAADSEYHHLDAALETLTGSPWDENHDGTNVGRCQDLYRKLYNLKKRLFIRIDSATNTLETFKSDAYFKSDANDDGTYEEIRPYQEIQLVDSIASKTDLDETVAGYYSLVFKDVVLNENDYALLGINNKIQALGTTNYFYKATAEGLKVSISKSNENITDSSNFLLIIVRDKTDGNKQTYISKEALYKYIDENEYISVVRSKLFEIYNEIQLLNKKNVPQLYLTYDENGNLVWDNRLVPNTQTEVLQKKFKYSENPIVNGKINIELDNVKFFADSKLLLIFDNTFIYDFSYDIVDRHITISIKAAVDEFWYDVENKEEFTITLVVINNTAGSILAELAKDYVTKEEALQLKLGNKDILLSNYVKKSELSDKANKYHSHSQYSSVDHTHDFRYADYQHRHDEYMTLADYHVLEDLDGVLGNNGKPVVEELKKKIDEIISNKTVNQVKALLAHSGFAFDGEVDDKGNFGEGSFYNTTAETFIQSFVDGDAAHKILKWYKENYAKKNNGVEPDLPYGLRLDEMIDLLIQDRDDVSASEVYLEKDLPVLNEIGGISRELEGLKRDDNGIFYYSKGTKIENILRDLLNKGESEAKRRAKLTPKDIRVEFYSDSEGLNKIEAIDYSADEVHDIYFRIVDIINEENESLLPYLNSNDDSITVAEGSKVVVNDNDIIYIHSDEPTRIPAEYLEADNDNAINFSLNFIIKVIGVVTPESQTTLSRELSLSPRFVVYAIVVSDSVPIYSDIASSSVKIFNNKLDVMKDSYSVKTNNKKYFHIYISNQSSNYEIRKVVTSELSQDITDLFTKSSVVNFNGLNYDVYSYTFNEGIDTELNVYFNGGNN